MSKSPFRKDGFQHYYVRNDMNQPIATVAICPGTEEGKIIRGIALCSHIDEWDRCMGRKKAVGRCKKAMNTKANSDPIILDRADTPELAPEVTFEFIEATRPDATVYSIDAPEYGEPQVFKSCFNVIATEKEAQILKCMKEKETDA